MSNKRTSKFTSNPYQEMDNTVTKEVVSKPNLNIQKNIQEYSKLLSILLTSPDRQTLADTLSKMNRMDLQFKRLGMRFTLKVGAEKID